jgi:hypothetical protein
LSIKKNHYRYQWYGRKRNKKSELWWKPLWAYIIQDQQNVQIVIDTYVQFTFVLITEKVQSCRPKPGRRLTESSKKTRQGPVASDFPATKNQYNRTIKKKIPIEVPLASTYITVV